MVSRRNRVGGGRDVSTAYYLSFSCVLVLSTADRLPQSIVTKNVSYSFNLKRLTRTRILKRTVNSYKPLHFVIRIILSAVLLQKDKRKNSIGVVIITPHYIKRCNHLTMLYGLLI